MSANYDIISVGAGHNGLVAAAYLAKAGKKVLVLERKPHAGGGVSTRELTLPGFRHDEHSNVHIMIQGNPMIRNDELGLFAKFGMKYHYFDTPHVTVFEDQTTIFSHKSLDKTCESIAKVSARDAETYRRFAEASMQLLPMFLSGLYAPPLPMGAFCAMLDQSDEGRDLFDAMQRSSSDIANRLFESDKVKIHLVRLITENLQMPDELGTGMGMYLMPGIIHTYGVSAPIGGSGLLSESLVRCIEAYGGKVLCDREVTKINISGGRAKSVVLSDGEEFTARDAVIGGIHPARLKNGIEPRVLARADKVTPSSFSILHSHYALKAPAKYIAGDEVGQAKMIELVSTSNYEEMMADYDALRRGRVPDRRLIAGGDDSHFDKTRVPEGRGIFYGVTFAPYQLADGGAARWDEYKEQAADHSLAYYRRFISNMNDDDILARFVMSPLDMERTSPNSFVRGDMHGCAPFFYQTMAHRPTPDLGQYTIPGIENYYMVGPFMHPGGGVFGAGRGTAMRMFDDLGIGPGEFQHGGKPFNKKRVRSIDTIDLSNWCRQGPIT